MSTFAAYTHAGRVKPVNQDAYCFKEAATPAGPVLFGAICDGVGGLAKGELASATVVRRCGEWFDGVLPALVRRQGWEDGVRSSLNELLLNANRDIYAHGKQAGKPCGTTITAIVAYQGRYLVAHVGDCRAYEVASGAATQLTKDQTLVQQQVDNGLITPEQARNHPKRNVILQSVGTQSSLQPVYTEGAWRTDALYVLCCDGFYNRLDEGELGLAFNSGDLSDEAALRQRCAAVVQSVMDRGEKDNVTVLAFGADGVLGDGGPTTSVPSAADEDALSTMLIAEDDFATVLVGSEDDAPTIVVPQGGEPR